jgi:tetratricopeptide (TPR) repeat protein
MRETPGKPALAANAARARDHANTRTPFRRSGSAHGRQGATTRKFASRRDLLAVCAATIVVVSTSSPAQAPSQRDTLRQYVAALQRAPGDQTLRENIIALSLHLSPRPEIPEEARRHFVKGGAIQKESKDPQALELAINEYNQALLVAAWWPEAYYNFGVALEQAGKFDAAIDALKLYLLTKPSTAEAREAQDKLYAIEGKKDLAARNAMAEAEQERRKEQEARDRTPDLSGEWTKQGEDPSRWLHRFEVNGTRVTIVSVNRLNPNTACKEIVAIGILDGHHISGVRNEGDSEGNVEAGPGCGSVQDLIGEFTGLISDDGRRVDITYTNLRENPKWPETVKSYARQYSPPIQPTRAEVYLRQ